MLAALTNLYYIVFGSVKYGLRITNTTTVKCSVVMCLISEIALLLCIHNYYHIIITDTVDRQE